jgi:FMN-dependent NADH-azoreductase
MKILKINSSSNKTTSASRLHVEKVVEKIEASHPDAEVIDRDVAYSNLPFIDENILGALFSQEKSEEQKKAISFSDLLTQEFMSADHIVIGCPIYNFTLPAALKAYFDLIARAGMTFKYTDHGPVGLLSDKKVTFVISSGGTAVGSDYDFCSGYLKTFMNFLGLTDIQIIPVDELLFRQEDSFAKAGAMIDDMAV